MKHPEDDPGAEAEDGGTGERYVQRSPRSHGHRRDKLLWCPKKRMSHLGFDWAFLYTSSNEVLKRGGFLVKTAIFDAWWLKPL